MDTAEKCFNLKLWLCFCPLLSSRWPQILLCQKKTRSFDLKCPLCFRNQCVFTLPLCFTWILRNLVICLFQSLLPYPTPWLWPCPLTSSSAFLHHLALSPLPLQPLHLNEHILICVRTIMLFLTLCPSLFRSLATSLQQRSHLLISWWMTLSAQCLLALSLSSGTHSVLFTLRNGKCLEKDWRLTTVGSGLGKLLVIFLKGNLFLYSCIYFLFFFLHQAYYF